MKKKDTHKKLHVFVYSKNGREKKKIKVTEV